MADWVRQGTVRRRKSVTLNGVNGAAGSMTSGAAFQVFLTVNMGQPGTVTITWSVTLSGTLAAGDANNMALDYGGPPDTQIAAAVYPAVAGTYPQAPVTVTLPAGSTTLKIRALGNTPTTGSVYSATMTTTGLGSVTFGVDWSANHKWVVSDIIVATDQNPAVAPYPTATAYLGGQQVGVSEGATWTGNQDTMRGEVEMTCDDLTVAFTGGLAGSVATAVLEGDSYLMR